MIEEIKTNVDNEIQMLREISNYYKMLESASPSESKLLLAAIDSLAARIKILNDSIPEMLSNVSLAKPLTEKKGPTNLENLYIHSPESELRVTLNAKDKEIFISQLRINEQLIKKLKKKGVIEQEEYTEFKSARGYLKMSNKYFLGYSQKAIDGGYFRSLYLQIKKANIDVLFSTYVAMIFFTTFLAVLASLLLLVFFTFFSVSLSLENPLQIITFYSGNILTRFVHLLWIPIALPIATFGILYYYPSTEKDSLEKRIDSEIPFAAVQMSAISGSGVEPSEIFKIIVIGNEYPFLKKEIRKIMNQINLYGYDLVTSLSNVAKTTPSAKLSELFAGLATTITSGGDLQTFFEKRAETLLMSYRLEREKYTKIAETFMDIYISVVIAAPMILLILLVMLSVVDLGINFTRTQMTLGIIAVVSLINVIFLSFLHMKQPSY